MVIMPAELVIMLADFIIIAGIITSAVMLQQEAQMKNIQILQIQVLCNLKPTK